MRSYLRRYCAFIKRSRRRSSDEGSERQNGSLRELNRDAFGAFGLGHINGQRIAAVLIQALLAAQGRRVTGAQCGWPAGNRDVEAPKGLHRIGR